MIYFDYHDDGIACAGVSPATASAGCWLSGGDVTMHRWAHSTVMGRRKGVKE